MPIRLTSIGMSLLAALICMPLSATDFAFTPIVGSQDGYFFGNVRWGLNNGGEVAFFAEREDGSYGIFKASGGPVTTIIQDDFITYDDFGVPTINDAGQVAFTALRPDYESEILRGSGGLVTTIATTDGPLAYLSFDVSINNAGDVAFSAERDDFEQGVFVGDGTTLRTIYTTDTSQFDGSARSPSLNNAGQVAFESALDDGCSGLFVFTSGTFAKIADDTGPLVSTSDPDLNNNGRVAFYSITDDGGEAIFSGDGGALTTVAQDDERFALFFGDPALNDRGEVAFRVTPNDGNDQFPLHTDVYLYTNGTLERVLGSGDALFGSTVLELGLPALNDLGQLAFTAYLENGQDFIVRADLVHVPEPGTWLLFISAVAPAMPFFLYSRLTRVRSNPS